jgi:hypothetical protein
MSTHMVGKVADNDLKHAVGGVERVEVDEEAEEVGGGKRVGGQ